MPKHRITRIAVKFALAAVSVGIIAGYAVGLTPETAAEYLREVMEKNDGIGCDMMYESPAPQDISGSFEMFDSFEFTETPDILPHGSEEFIPETVMNMILPEYKPEVTNQTSYKIEESLMERETVKLEDIEGPQVLIVHTHSSESYASDEAMGYASDADRTLDTKYNVVRVGDELAKYLEEAGVKVLHDRIINDYPSYNGSYSRMLKRINAYIEENPTIKLVLDVHRDAIYYRDGTPYAAVTEIDGERTAQIMLVVGTDEGGLSHENWRDNMAFAMKLQRQADTDMPGLMRKINLRKERFNQHTTPGSLIVEVGTTGNTLTEALCGVRKFGDALLKVIK